MEQRGPRTRRMSAVVHMVMTAWLWNLLYCRVLALRDTTEWLIHFCVSVQCLMYHEVTWSTRFGQDFTFALIQLQYCSVVMHRLVLCGSEVIVLSACLIYIAPEAFALCNLVLHNACIHYNYVVLLNGLSDFPRPFALNCGFCSRSCI